MPSRISITDAVSRLRGELAAAQRMAEKKEGGIRFKITNLELELLVEMEREGGGNAAVGIGVIEAGVNGRRSRTHSHKITLALEVQGVEELADFG